MSAIDDASHVLLTPDDIRHIVAQLAAIQIHRTSDDEAWIDVRLQIDTDGAWRLHTGDAQYDTDHRGYWGSAEIGPTTDIPDLAADLIDQAADHYCQHTAE